MSDSHTQPEVVDDFYWLRRAAQLVQEEASARARAAERLTTTVAWLWTAFLVVGGAVFATADPDPWSATILFLLVPSVLLVVAYLCALFAAMPRFADFDPRVPSEIERAHRQASQKGRRLLRLAMVATVVAAIAVVFGMVGLKLTTDDPTEPSVAIVRDSGGGVSTIGIDGRVSDDTVVFIRTKPESRGISRTKVVRSDDDGKFDVTVRVRGARKYVVTVSWTDSSERRWEVMKHA